MFVTVNGVKLLQTTNDNIWTKITQVLFIGMSEGLLASHKSEQSSNYREQISKDYIRVINHGHNFGAAPTPPPSKLPQLPNSHT